MKKLSILLFVLLTGCSTMNNIFMAPFDNNEYYLVDQIRTQAQLGKCDQNSVDKLYVSGLELKNYSEYLPKNEKTIDMTKNLFTMINELHNKQNPSQVYCSAKLNIIGISAERIQQSIGKRPR